jgi:hypothetical protein
VPARPYRPSGKSDPGALPALFVATLVAGALAGALLGVITHALIDLLIIFPLLVGLAAGGVAAWRIGAGKVRAPLVAAVIGLVGGLAGQVTKYAVDYQFFRQRVAEAFADESPGTEVGPALDEYLRQHTGSAGFVGFLKFQAEKGITLKNHGDKGIELTGAAVWVLWIVELLIAGGTAAGLAVARAKEPFCEKCSRWYDRDEAVAEGAAERWKDVVAAVERGDAAGALAARGERTPKARAVLRLVACSKCEAHEPVLRIVVGTRLDTKKPNEKRVYESLVRHELGRALREAAAGAPGQATGA